MYEFFIGIVVGAIALELLWYQRRQKIHRLNDLAIEEANKEYEDGDIYTDENGKKYRFDAEGYWVEINELGKDICVCPPPETTAVEKKSAQFAEKKKL